MAAILSRVNVLSNLTDFRYLCLLLLELEKEHRTPAMIGIVQCFVT